MPRHYKRPPGTKPYVPVDLEKLEKAVKEVKDGKLSFREAAQKYNIDKMKIYRKCKNLKQRKYGGQTTLSDVEETVLKGKAKYLNLWTMIISKIGSLTSCVYYFSCFR